MVACYRDDMESIFLLLVYMLKGFKLPWFPKNASDFRLSDIQKVFDVRRNKNWDTELLADLPEELEKIWIKINKLGLNDVPNYCDFRETLFKLYYD